MTPKGKKDEDQGAQAAPKGGDKTDGKDAAPKHVDPEQAPPATDEGEPEQRKDATAEPGVVTASAKAHRPESTTAPAPDSAVDPAGQGGMGGSVSYDRPPGSDVVMTGTPNQNAASQVRTEELHLADRIVRGGTVPIPSYPQALPREQQEENAAEMAGLAAANATGAKDGVATVYPQVAGPTNLAMTQAEVLSQLDDGAVDERGRLAGTYLDDLQEEEQARRRERIEGFASSPVSRAAAGRVRELAQSPAMSASDLGRPADQRALVDPNKRTGSGDPNDQIRRAREVTDAEQGKPAGARA